MDFLSLTLLLSAILLADEVLNHQLKISKRLLHWFDQLNQSSKNQNRSIR